MSQANLLAGCLENNTIPQRACNMLGISFASDEARRAHFTEELRQKLQDPEFRRLKAFPSAATKTF